MLLRIGSGIVGQSARGAGLNHDEVGTLGRLIRDIRDTFTLTVLLVEHHMSLVMKVSDQVVALNFVRGADFGEFEPGGGARAGNRVRRRPRSSFRAVPAHGRRG